MRNRVDFLIALLLVVMGFSSPAIAQPGRDKDPLSWDRQIHRIVRQYCVRCHNTDESSGNVNLAQYHDIRRILEHRRTWEVALTVIERGEMPPEDERQPSDEQRRNLIEFIRQTLNDLDCSEPADPGYPNVRRLNRVEYDLTIEDLTGLKLGLAEDFAPDASAYGFDHLGEVLSLSPTQMQQYYRAAKTIVSELINQKTARPELYEQAFGKQPSGTDDERTQAQLTLVRFATRAFRRPVDPSYIDQLMKLYDKARQKQQTHEEATGHLLSAILISPQFLLRLEQSKADTTEPYPVDDYELATRLSYFLWSRAPDDTLLRLASEGKLSNLETLESQVRRMLGDPRSVALAENFFGQWLSLRDAKTHQPDRERFPEFDEPLRTAMIEEMRLFLTELVQQDGPITDLIDADYTYLNETLAGHYGIDGDFDRSFQRVQLKDRRRGGVVTSAALTMLLADPGRTNVPRRGNFIAGRLLGTPPPPPPPNVPPLEEIANDGESKTLRELLELHRSEPGCASCHAKMDPLGFALENYDAIGRWREKDNGLPIDASGERVGGQSFSGPLGLKDVLLSEKEAFRKTLTQNLLIYALGRGLRGSDECVVRDCVESAEKNDDRFSSLVIAIVKSVPFRYRRNPID
ncbi:hypothetical protein Pla52o_29360 [Novipirellula galeiformis]|uniref:Planctomycete cytochrome C n=1 Tax=Novipirellula galeiformis TaxID=2528004 RepID=A0A5C6CFJ9_9BACT|nr:DUF1592 domain-containing protein [Novipirellula galeiformis]TWU23400.1 hypothetical protein Pla52o_29360 [Novipirellula galeiformis]